MADLIMNRTLHSQNRPDIKHHLWTNLDPVLDSIVVISVCRWVLASNCICHSADSVLSHYFCWHILGGSTSDVIVLNAYFGAMTLLPYWKFILATTLSTPRLFIPIFIGHNISSLADPTIVGKDRVLKWGMNILGIIIALAVGWYIYRHTVRRIERINAGLAPDESEEEEETVGLGRQQQHQHSSGSNEQTDQDSFDLEEVTPHKYTGVPTGHVSEMDAAQGYSQPGHYASNSSRETK